MWFMCMCGERGEATGMSRSSTAGEVEMVEGDAERVEW